MKSACAAFRSMLVAALLTSCSSRPPTSAQSSKAELDHFKTALIAYIDMHPGFFIGRANADGLRNKQLIVVESPAPERRYLLEEFVIIPRKMRFQANYGMGGSEPYCYEGEFTNSASRTLQVGEVKLTRFYIRRQQTD